MANSWTPLTPGQTLRSPDGRQWKVLAVSGLDEPRAEAKVRLQRLDKQPREHQVVTKDYYPVQWNWEIVP